MDECEAIRWLNSRSIGVDPLSFGRRWTVEQTFSLRSIETLWKREVEDCGGADQPSHVRVHYAPCWFSTASRYGRTEVFIDASEWSLDVTGAGTARRDPYPPGIVFRIYKCRELKSQVEEAVFVLESNIPGTMGCDGRGAGPEIS